jgi:hypothetical protein
MELAGYSITHGGTLSERIRSTPDAVGKMMGIAGIWRGGCASGGGGEHL